MRIRCSHCGLDLDVPADAEGKTLRCPDCRQSFLCRLPKAIIVDEGPMARSPRPLEPVGAELILDEEVPEPEEIVELTDETEPAEAMESGPPEDALAALGKSAPKRTVRENPRQWYVMVAGVAAVALTWKELVGKARGGQVKPKDRIYYAPKDLTLQAREVPGLFADADTRRAKAARPVVRPVVVAADKEADSAANALGQLGGETGAAGEAPGRPGENADSAADAMNRLGAKDKDDGSISPSRLGKERRRQRREQAGG